MSPRSQLASVSMSSAEEREVFFWKHFEPNEQLGNTGKSVKLKKKSDGSHRSRKMQANAYESSEITSGKQPSQSRLELKKTTAKTNMQVAELRNSSFLKYAASETARTLI